MNGVELLAFIPKQSNDVYLYVLIPLAIAAGIIFIVLVEECEINDGGLVVGLVVIGLLCFAIGILVNETHESYYIAKIDKDVSLIEFDQKYKIIKQYDNVYFIEEK